MAAVLHKILRHWLTEGAPTPEDLYALIRSDMSARFVVSVSYTSAPNFLDWTWKTLYMSVFGEKLFDLKGLLAPSGRYEDVYHIPHHRNDIFPKLDQAYQSGRPVMGTIDTRMLGFHIYSDQLILPEKADGKPSWLFSCARMRLLSRMPHASVILEPMDEKLISMFATGETAKAIARELDISYRSVEHRLARIKQRVGADSLPELLVLVSASGYGKYLAISDQGSAE